MRFDEYLVNSQKSIKSRSQAQDLIKRGKVRLGTKIITKPSYYVKNHLRVQILEKQLYVSRAGHKLESVATPFKLKFHEAIVLDIGSSTGGFTDYALRNKAATVVAVDVGTDQMDPRVSASKRVMLFEKTDIRDFKWPEGLEKPDIVVMDLSFISLTKILPDIKDLLGPKTLVVAMSKPQFEADGFKLNDGVVRNSRDRAAILSRLEDWFKQNNWVVLAKQDSGLAGGKGNVERFYKLVLGKLN